MMETWWEQAPGRERYKESKLPVGGFPFLFLCGQPLVQITLVRLLSIAHTAAYLPLGHSCLPSSYPEDTSAHSTSDLPWYPWPSRHK
jgi:hypothetical protein